MSHKEETHIFQVHIPFPFDAFFSHKSFLTYLCSHQCLSHIKSLIYFYLLPMTKKTLFLWFCYLMLTVYTGWGFTVSKTAIIFFLYLYRPHRNLVFSSVVTPPWWKSYLNSYHYSLIFESSKIKNGKIKLHKAFWEMLVAVIHTIWKFLLMFLLAWLRNEERNYFKV